MTIAQALGELRNVLDTRYDKRAPVVYGIVTSVVRDAYNNTVGAVATINNVTNQQVRVPYGTPIGVGAQVEAKIVDGDTVNPQYQLVAVVTNNAVVQLDMGDTTIPSPTLTSTSQWDTGIVRPDLGGPFGGMTAYLTATFVALDYVYYKIAYYTLQCKRSTSADWEFSHQIPATGYSTGAAISYRFDGLEVGTPYDVRVSAQSVSPDQYSDWSYAGKTTAGDTTAPAAPSVGTISDVSLPGAISLEWSDNIEYDVAYYRVYYKTVDSGWVRVSDGGTPTDYYQTAPSDITFAVDFTATTSWYFRITAVDTSGNESSFSATVGPYQPAAASTVGAAPSTPSGLTGNWYAYVVNGTQLGRVDLSWNASTFSDASSGYVIRWQESANGSFSGNYRVVGVQNTLSHVIVNLKPAQYYQYEISAYDASGRTSGWSSAFNLTSGQTSADTTPPANVAGLTLIDFDGPNLSFKWNANTEEDLQGYIVQIHSALPPSEGNKLRAEFVGASSTSGSTPQYTYTYEKNTSDSGGIGDGSTNVAIKAIDTAGNMSASFTTATFTNPPPGAPEVVSALPMFREIQFTWETSTQKDFKEFEIAIEEADDSNGTNAFMVVSGVLLTSPFFTYKCSAGRYYQASVKQTDVFYQSSNYTVSDWTLCEYERIITPEDLAGRAYQITPTASSGLTDASGGALSTAEIEQLLDYNTATVAVKNPNTSAWRYVDYEFPVQHIFNKTMIAYSGGSLKFYVAYSTDNTTWKYLSGDAGNQLTGSLSDTLTLVGSQSTAQTQAPTLAGPATKHIRWPTMAQAKWIRCYVNSVVDLCELKHETYIIADTIDAGTVNLAKGIQLYDDATGSGFQITSTGASFWNSKLSIYSQPSGSASSRIEIVGESIRAFNGATKTVEILGGDGTNPGSIWATKGGFGGTGVGNATIKLDGATGGVSIAGTVLVGTSDSARIEITGGTTGTIRGYDSANTLQAYFDTDGTIKAGGGAVQLTKNGIRIASHTGDGYMTSNTVYWGDEINVENGKCGYILHVNTGSVAHTAIGAGHANGLSWNIVNLYLSADDAVTPIRIIADYDTGSPTLFSIDANGHATTGGITIGGLFPLVEPPPVATSGLIRIPNNEGLLARNNGNTANITLIATNTSDEIIFGSTPKVSGNSVVVASDSGKIPTSVMQIDKSAYVALADKTATADNSWEQWDSTSGTLTFTNPGKAVTVVAWLTGRAYSANAKSITGSYRISVSWDGGSTWNDQSNAVMRTDIYNANQPMACVFRYAPGSVPTGDIKVRAYINSNADTESEYNEVTYMNGLLLARIYVES